MNGDGITIGVRDCYLEDDFLCIENNDIVICLEKTSDSQRVSNPDVESNIDTGSDSEETNDNLNENEQNQEKELIYEYAYYTGTYSCKQYYLLDIDNKRFVRFSTADTYYDEGDIAYHSTAEGFELGEPIFLIYDGYDINDTTVNEYFVPGVYGATISIWSGEEWIEWDAKRELNVLEAERLLEEIKNN